MATTSKQTQAQLDAEAWAIVADVAEPLADLTDWVCHRGLCDPSECTRCKKILRARQLLARKRRLDHPPAAEFGDQKQPASVPVTERQSDR